ncbi:MAG TPA: hypothetical protein VJY62_18515 [Bacteroidia bacterium]|nr:hypothetical protein [Bacteroidia bacterium]
MVSSFKFILLISAILIACSGCKQNIVAVQQSTPADSPRKDSKQIEATVIDYSEVDGCRFLLELTNKEKLQPENLPAEFEKDKMQVMIKYHVTNKNTVCMAGKTVYIDFIKAKTE